MARVLVAAQSTPGAYPALQPAANSRDVVFQACDPSLKNYTPLVEGKTLILVRNDHATTARTVTFSSVADAQNRTGDITAYSIDAAEDALFGPFKAAGWSQAGAQVWFEGSTTDIKFAVITLP